jgi:antitoxin component of RelBE/YafQ-DinJ toxin-antitoxin module
VLAAALRVILEWLASMHEAALPKHDALSAVRAWYLKNGVDFGRHDTNVLSLMTAVIKKAGLAVSKAGRLAVKRAVGRKANPVNAVFSDDDSTSESSSSSSCYIDFSFTRVAE